MTVQELLTALMIGGFLILGILPFFDYIRHREIIKRDTALAFGVIALSVSIALVQSFIPNTPSFLRTIASVALIAQPYLLLRLVRYLQPIAVLAQRFGLFGMIISWACLLVGSALPAVSLIIVAYFIVVNAYAMIIFIRGTRTTSGVVYRRLQLCAIGCGLFTSSLLLSLVALIPSLRDIATIVVEITAILSAVSFLMGIVPPRWLRRIWQTAELRDYLVRLSHTIITEPNVNLTLTELAQTANRVAGALSSVVLDMNSGQPIKHILYTIGKLVASDIQVVDESAIQRVWQSKAATYVTKSSALNRSDQRLLEQMQAETLIIVPINTSEHDIAMLLVFLRNRSLFPDDDLELLKLLAQQAAIFSENLQLVEQLRHYSENLERTVEERTQALRASEESLQQLNQELEQRIAERTAHLEAVNRELESFSYSVSHDLRAPLRALDGFSQALLEDYHKILDEEGREYLELIRFESQRMGQLIDDLIGLSRLSRSELRQEEIDLSVMVHEVAERLRAQDPQRAVEFSVEGNLNVYGDSHLLRVAIQNLVGNAWKYSGKQDHARIEFGCSQVNGTATYFVRDNGVGFDMAYVHKLFGAFQRLHSMTEFEGTGIGLATVQRIIHRHGGSIWAEGTVNGGATFYFTLETRDCKEGNTE